MKESVAFQLAVQSVIHRDPRYSVLGYAFLCEALNYTVIKLNRENQETRHVSGQELLIGLREFALKEFGPLSWLVMKEWGICSSEDVGSMVYHLIEVGYFGRNEKDSIQDFSDGICLESALTSPYGIASPVKVKRVVKEKAPRSRRKAS